METCTWEGCQNTAEILQEADDGQIWANLCPEHDAKLTKAIKVGNARLVFACWVKAQGGGSVAAKRTVDDLLGTS